MITEGGSPCHWQRCHRFADLVSLSASRPWRIPKDRISLSQGVATLRPPVVHQYPSWDLSIILQVLTSPFEPLKTASLRLLTFKVAFLVAVTLARRISELAEFSVPEDLCTIRPDRVILKLDPSFIPKVNWFHRFQEDILTDFCPGASHPTKKRWHKLDIR